jgi:hypothetical protein
MNPRGRPGPEPGPRPGPGPGVPVAWALLVIAAALVGGLAAAALVHTSLIVTVLVAVIAGVIAIAVFRSPAGPPDPSERLTSDRAAPARAGFPDARSRTAPTAPTTPVTPVAPAPPATSASAVPTAPVVQLLPVQAQNQAGASWWDAAAGAPPPPSAAAQLAPAPDLSTYMASTFIAQCPACGAFRLDSRRTQEGWDFRCESCEYIWAWQPGTPWPPVRVMPGRRRKSRPPSP